MPTAIAETPRHEAGTTSPYAPADHSRAESFLEERRKRRHAREAEAATHAAAGQAESGPRISFGELLLMLFFAGLFDLAALLDFLIPGMSVLVASVGNAVFGLWFYFKKIPFSTTRSAFIAETIIELIPYVSALPAFLGLVTRVYLIQRTNQLAGSALLNPGAKPR